MASNYTARSDHDLVLACQRREPSAFEELVKRYQKPVYILLYQLAPEWANISDLSQDVFIRVWRTINNLRNPASFRSWLTKQVMTRFYEELATHPQTNNGRNFALTDWDSAGSAALNEEQDKFIESCENILSDDPAVLIAEGLKRMPEALRTPIVLKELEGLNYEEIAILTKTEVGTVKSRIARTRTLLQKMLNHCLKRQISAAEVAG